MQKNRKKAGFSMAELLIVIGIIAVLAAVSFVGVISYMRSMTKLQYDGYAKEIFIAAQNHLTMAKSQGYLGKESLTNPFGNLGIEINRSDGSGKIEGTGDGDYYFVVNGSNGISPDSPSTILNLMLPFGSVDETIRLGGCYIIRYHKDTGVVLDVFYWTENGRYPFAYSGTNDYIDLMQKAYDSNHKELLKNYDSSDKKAVIGYYGGEEAKSLARGSDLNKPTLTIKNAEKLTVTVTNTNYTNPKAELKLIITGVTSNARKELKLCTLEGAGVSKARTNNADNYSFITPEKGTVTTEQHEKCKTYTIVLDDITSEDGHFYDLFCTAADSQGKYFIPGENVTIQAVAYNNSELSNIAYSSKRTTNSLFGSIKTISDNTTAAISNIRHLENLDVKVSNLEFKDPDTALPSTNKYNTLPENKKLNFDKAEQRTDLNWKEFKDNIGGTNIWIYEHKPSSGNADKLTTTDKTYYPVTLTNIEEYNGKNHSIFDVQINYVDTDSRKGAGLFSSLNKKEVLNLKLVDFEVTGDGNVGALAGSVSDNSKISNVVAINAGDPATTGHDEKSPTIHSTGTNGSAGGLIGQVSDSDIEKCAAAVVVSAVGNAGGLIGTIADTGRTTPVSTITACYSGGHTKNASYSDVKVNNTDTAPVYNVSSTGDSGNAGGLVGDAGAATISYSYSTCSATGSVVGGFVGTASGTISDCYSTGLVTASGRNAVVNTLGYKAVTTNEGAFVGYYSGANTNSITNCNYFEIINERASEDNSGFQYLKAMGRSNATETNPENVTQPVGITALDASAATYNSFVGAMNGDPADTNAKKWEDASSYDPDLGTYYKNKYNLKTVKQLLPVGGLVKTDNGGNPVNDVNGKPVIELGVNDDDFVKTHYGDWPAPEIFVINTPSS